MGKNDCKGRKEHQVRDWQTMCSSAGKWRTKADLTTIYQCCNVRKMPNSSSYVTLSYILSYVAKGSVVQCGYGGAQLVRQIKDTRGVRRVPFSLQSEWVCMGTVESWPEALIEHLGKRTQSALGAQVKAIQLWDQKGLSLTAPLLDLIEGLTALGKGLFLEIPPSWSFLLWALMFRLRRAVLFPFLITPFYCVIPFVITPRVSPFHCLDLSDCYKSIHQSCGVKMKIVANKNWRCNWIRRGPCRSTVVTVPCRSTVIHMNLFIKQLWVSRSRNQKTLQQQK